LLPHSGHLALVVGRSWIFPSKIGISLFFNSVLLIKELVAVLGFSNLHFLQINMPPLGTRTLPQLGQYSGLNAITFQVLTRHIKVY